MIADHTAADAFSQAVAEFERVQNARFVGSEMDIKGDALNLHTIGSHIYAAHVLKAQAFYLIATATCCQRSNGAGYVGRYDIATACQAEIDYLEVTPEAAMVVEARVAELLAGAA